MCEYVTDSDKTSQSTVTRGPIRTSPNEFQCIRITTIMIINNVVDGGTSLRLPAHMSLGQHLIDCLRVNSEADDLALVNGDTGEETRYSQVLQGTVDAASGLARLGIRRGETVALCGENSVEYLYSALGTICCGATVTTMNLMYTKDELLHALGLSRPRFVIASQIALSIHLDTLKSYPSIEKIIQLNGDTPVDSGVLLLSEVQVKGSDVRCYEPAPVEGYIDTAFILYSSGTTGLPKGVMLTHKNMLYSVAMFELKDRERTSLLSIVPWFHAYGLMSTINYLVVKSLLFYFSGGFDPQKYLQTIQDYKVRVLMAVPPIVVFLGKAPLVEQYDLSSVVQVWCGAAPLSSETIQAAMKRLPNCQGIYQAYGMTETSLAATKDEAEEGSRLKAGSGGYPVPGVKVKVVDIETRKKLGANENGEVCIKGPIIMKGYIGNEAETKAMFDEEGYLKTGDIGYYDSDGCFFIVDRLKELIKYKGYQVAPAAVESVILQHSGVAECGVVGAPDDSAGELPTAFVVPKPGVKLTEKEILDFTSPKLSASSRLHGGVIIVSEIPKNPSGKLLRRELKKLLQQRKKSKL